MRAVVRPSYVQPMFRTGIRFQIKGNLSFACAVAGGQQMPWKGQRDHSLHCVVEQSYQHAIELVVLGNMPCCSIMCRLLGYLWAIR